ncbi:hypothetical protein GQ55_7G281100 [Panicum hallii var. hallii]|uniref:Uncharacterized protein n=1 Tax=Panicum hallii var. hallii TaxID=1504633 RepID=A0A2T7CZU6_9POAL|nr:hypothetical protein GQ55_7G281100 [Panicum hallii var. hallii]
MFRLWLVALQARKNIYQQKLTSHEPDHGPQKRRVCRPYHCRFQSKAFWFLVLLIGFSDCIVQKGVGYSGHCCTDSDS